jgi:hypothetical protein
VCKPTQLLLQAPAAAAWLQASMSLVLACHECSVVRLLSSFPYVGTKDRVSPAKRYAMGPCQAPCVCSAESVVAVVGPCIWVGVHTLTVLVSRGMCNATGHEQVHASIQL